MKANCTECGQEHDFPPVKFQGGTRVRLVREGTHHNDKIGQEFVVVGLNRTLSMPCDENEYFLEGTRMGSVLESRLEAVE